MNVRETAGQSSETVSQQANNPFGNAPDLWFKIQKLRLLDDLLMRVVLDGNTPAVELILRIILGKPDLTVSELHVQSDIKLLISRGLRLDVRAIDAQGSRYNIEVQRSDSGAHPKRARYHSALMDATTLREGETTDALTKTWVIFITETDYFRLGLPVYMIARTITNAENKPFGDESYIAYANAAYIGDDDLGHLMADFRTAEPDRMHFKILADGVRKAKSQQKGVSKMSQVLEEMMQMGYEQGAEAKEFELILRAMQKLGLSLEQTMVWMGVSLSKLPAYQARLENQALYTHVH